MGINFRKIFLDDLKKKLEECPACGAFLLFLASFSILLGIFLLSNGDPVPDDHYFHFKYAYLLRTEGWDVVENFDWIYLSKNEGANTRYSLSLYQVLLVPFTYFDDWQTGVQVVDAFFASAVLAMFYFVLCKADVKRPLFFTLLILSVTYFSSRMLLGRAFVIIVPLIYVEMWLAVEKKYKALFFVSLLHVLWHQATYFMPFLVVSMVEASRYLLINKFFYKNGIAVILGTLCGLAFFPGFPMSVLSRLKNIVFVQSDAMLNGNIHALGGVELMPKNFMEYLIDAEFLLLLFIISIVIVVWIYVQLKKKNGSVDEKVSEKKIQWIFASFMFMIVMMLGSIAISGRFFDFLIPAIFVLCAMVYSYLVDMKLFTIDEMLGKFLKWGIVIYASVLIMSAGIHIYEKSNTYDHTPVKEVSLWLKDRSQEGEKVFLYNWSNFVLLFFENSHNYYSMGIEPMALKKYNELLYWKYYNIFWYNYYCVKIGDCKNDRDEVIQFLKNTDSTQKEKLEKDNSKKIIKSIKNDFGAKFIVSDSDAFTKMIQLNPELIEDQFYTKSEKYKGLFMEYTVFELK